MTCILFLIDQPAINSPDVIDYNGVAKVIDHGVTGHYSSAAVSTERGRGNSSDQKRLDFDSTIVL